MSYKLHVDDSDDLSEDTSAPLDEHPRYEPGQAENSTLNLLCRKQHEAYYEVLQMQGHGFCEAIWDSASCWPPTLVGSEAQVPCPTDFRGVTYDAKYNATRFCGWNATWANKSDYDACMNYSYHPHTDDTHDPFHLGLMGVYYVGYIISLLSACGALWLFFYFRTLHCLRNTLHCNLIITYILLDFTWIVMTSIFWQASENKSKAYRFDCRFIVALFNYFQVTNFFWMLVEGLYIILIIFRTHKLELLCYWPFAVIGWGMPIIVIVAWVCVKILFDDVECWWITITSTYNFVYIGPILFVLAVNMTFLVTIMNVLLRKYRGTTTTAASTRRAAKSFLILLPLLGITYVMFVVLPPERSPLRTILEFINAFLSSLQGFFVSLLYCFLNNEVRAIIRLRGNSFFPYRTWLKLDSSSNRRSPRSFTTSADGLFTGIDSTPVIPLPPALSRYRQNENLRRLQINTMTANKNELAYLLKEKEHQDRIQKQMRHQAMGYRSTVF